MPAPFTSPHPPQRDQCVYDGRELVAVIERRSDHRWHVIDRHGADVGSYETRALALASTAEMKTARLNRAEKTRRRFRSQRRAKEPLEPRKARRKETQRCHLMHGNGFARKRSLNRFTVIWR
jgi:hypothetical protein